MAAARLEEERSVQKASGRKQDVCEVQISDNVYQVCISHALMTEREEVMGLLLGDAVGEHVRIWASVTLRRSDKRADRVEISPEQLVEAAEMAEDITKEFHCPTRVVGWYHSHPHITCFPSHVDLRTQLQYQGMDGLFIGLIFAVFNADPRAGRMRHELMAFRADVSGSGPPRRLELQPRVVPLSALLSVDQEKLASSTASTSLRRCWGHRAMSAAAEQSFAEIQERHREEVAKLTGEGEELLWVEYCCRHSQQLNALLDREVVPLRQHFDDAVHNTEVLASVYREHSDWVQRQEQGALVAPEDGLLEPELDPPPLPPPTALTAGREAGRALGEASGLQQEAPAAVVGGHGGSRETSGTAAMLGCRCPPRASGVPAFCSLGCRPAVGPADAAEESRSWPDEGGAGGMLPVTVPEETQEVEPIMAPGPLLPREPSSQQPGAAEHQGRRHAEEAPSLQREEQVDLEYPESSSATASSSGRVLGGQLCGVKTREGQPCKMRCVKGANACAKHKGQLKKRRCENQFEAGSQREVKRQAVTSFRNFGEIETQTDRRSAVFIAKPCRDSDRFEPHPDSEDGQAQPRTFTSDSFGDAADSKAQQYLFGSKYGDLVARGPEGGRARA